METEESKELTLAQEDLRGNQKTRSQEKQKNLPYRGVRRRIR